MKLINRQTTLRTIQRKDLETIRTWRNLRSVNRYLASRDYITEQRQAEWFHNLDYATSIYFMMEDAAAAHGLIYARNIHCVEKCFEGSIFIGNLAHLNPQLPVKASLMLTLFFFDYLHFEYALSKVHHQNKAARDLDRHLGFKELRTEGEFIISRCGRPDFEARTARIRKTLLRSQPVEVITEAGDEKFAFFAGAKW